jgi:uncharacterized membrane protein YidH (DUF202 family)
MDENSAPESQFGAPSRRTYFAEERTILAWWRTGISSAAVALAVWGSSPTWLTCHEPASSPWVPAMAPWPSSL